MKKRKTYDKKAQMLDAGTALFKTKEGFGHALGRVRAEMDVYGKSLKTTEIDASTLPHSTGECDLFLDISDCWRNRYISCLVEDAGDTGERTSEGEEIRRYAAVFKEGNTSTRLRGGIHLLLSAGLVLLIISGNGACTGSFSGEGGGSWWGLARVACTIMEVVLVVALAVSWIKPSVKARKIVKEIQDRLRMM